MSAIVLATPNSPPAVYEDDPVLCVVAAGKAVVLQVLAAWLENFSGVEITNPVPYEVNSSWKMIMGGSGLDAIRTMDLPGTGSIDITCEDARTVSVGYGEIAAGGPPYVLEGDVAVTDSAAISAGGSATLSLDGGFPTVAGHNYFSVGVFIKTNSATPTTVTLNAGTYSMDAWVKL